MAKNLLKWTLFISSNVPVFLMIYLKSLKKFSGDEMEITWGMNPIFWILLLVISILSLGVLIFWLMIIKKDAGTSRPSYRPIKIESYDSQILNFFVTFIIPILSLDPESWPSIAMNIILLLIEGAFFVSNNTLYFNIVLLIFGYHIYSIGEDKILITKRKKSSFFPEESETHQVGTTGIYFI
ncbi:hypothetical protein [Leuconostoc lactis]|uniref:hypothetical protein n=1 Tax=Leuconostoc lactis TaxID=1246 RepID=UPI0022E09046|nr:hypothetical protein [Leuconostoc lactis]